MVRSSELYNNHQEESIPLADFRNLDIEESESTVSSIRNESIGLESPSDDIFRDVDQWEQVPKWKRFFIALWNGPREQQDAPVKRIRMFNFVEGLADRINDKIDHRFQKTILILYFIFWFGFCYNITIPYHTTPPYSTLDPELQVVSLSCVGDTRFWRGKNNACGINGDLCEPDLTEDVIFRCPALCDRSWTYSYIPIGDQNIKYRGYYVGGGDDVTNKIDDKQISNPYRADSSPCGAGVHSGIITAIFGGCARISYKSGSQGSFSSTPGHYGTDESISFDSFFPYSYFFKELKSSPDESFKQCTDPRIIVLILNIILGVPIVLFCSGLVVYWLMAIVGFWTIVLATDPPYLVDPSDPENFPKLMSLSFERFLPSCFVLYVLWKCSVKRTFTAPEDCGYKVSYIIRLIFWYPLFWLGILNNITFDRLPMDRLTMTDLKLLPGAFLTLFLIVTVVAVCAGIQAYSIWLSGRFKKYLAIYILMILSLVFLGNLPGLTLRIHHYILAILLIPGCATRGKSAYLLQGILLGLFLSGASRWGFASIVETSLALRRGDPSGHILPPQIVSYNSSGFLSWNSMPENITKFESGIYLQYDGVSLLINDIERYSGPDLQAIDLKLLLQQSDMADMISQSLTSTDEDVPIYIRIARKILTSERESDFSNAALLKWPSGELTLPEPGVT